MIDKRGTNIPPHFIIKVAYIIVVFFTFYVGKYISLFANLLDVDVGDLFRRLKCSWVLVGANFIASLRRKSSLAAC